jgi:2'-5' RNA ligase
MEPLPDEPLYFVGVGLPPLESAFFTKLKEKFHPQGKTKSPAHLTLKPPFIYPDRNRLSAILAKWAREQKPFWIKFEKVGSFNQRKYGTVFLEPDKGEALKRLASNLDGALPFLPATSAFIPHLTVANNVPHEEMTAAMVKIRSLKLELSLRVKSVTLYQRLPQEAWAAAAEFPFSPER